MLALGVLTWFILVIKSGAADINSHLLYHASVQSVQTDLTQNSLHIMEKREASLKYDNDPPRSSILTVQEPKPFNAELPGPYLVENFITPTERFYVRNHGPVPDINITTYKLTITGLVKNPIELSLQQLQTLFAASVTNVTATLMCAGNRRGEMNSIKKVKGTPWGVGAIGNAEWTGVPLYQVLLYAKTDLDNPNLHVEFAGADDCEEKVKYETSIPMFKAGDPRGDVLLAWAMNGKPLTRDHGYPLRVVVPGYIGARSVKWLKQINVIPRESPGRFQQKDYKLFLSNVDWDTVDQLWSTAEPIMQLSVQSAICDPSEGHVIAPNSSFTIKGYALSNGNRITRVDVSLDDGKNWQVAKIVHQDSRDVKGYSNRYWGWTLFQLRVPNLPASNSTIACRAWDSSSNTQPETIQQIWNLRGVLNNAYHRVHVSTSR